MYTVDKQICKNKYIFKSNNNNTKVIIQTNTVFYNSTKYNIYYNILMYVFTWGQISVQYVHKTVYLVNIHIKQKQNILLKFIILLITQRINQYT